MTKIKISISLIVLALLIVSNISAGDISKIELSQLDGKWQGNGEFLLPGVHTKVSIEGNAKFVYDKNLDRLRTSLTGEKLFFTYSDSGYLQINPLTDSVTWEVWDNRNKHAFYHGVRNGNVISGERMRKKDLYELKIIQQSQDTIEFKLIITQPDGDVYDKAVFNLWRVK